MGAGVRGGQRGQALAIQDLTDSLRRHRRSAPPPPHPLPSPDLVAMGINRARATGRPEHSSPAAQQPGPESGESRLGRTICFWGYHHGAALTLPTSQTRAGEDTGEQQAACQLPEQCHPPASRDPAPQPPSPSQALIPAVSRPLGGDRYQSHFTDGDTEEFSSYNRETVQ